MGEYPRSRLGEWRAPVAGVDWGRLYGGKRYDGENNYRGVEYVDNYLPPRELGAGRMSGCGSSMGMMQEEA